MDSDENKPSQRQIYVSNKSLPADTATPTEWMQRVTLLAEQMDELAAQLFRFLELRAPVICNESHSEDNAGPFIAGIGYLARGIAATGRGQLTKLGVEPIDAAADTIRLMREQAADPNCPEDLREHLLGVLGEGELAEEFPTGGVVLGID